MAGRLSGRVFVQHPEQGPRWFGPEDEVPGEYAALITNDKAWAEGGETVKAGSERPAQNDKKSQWVDYVVESHGVDRDDAEGMTKDELSAYGE